MRLYSLRPASVSPVVSQFVSVNVGNTLMLKALGFIEAQQAHIVNVTEGQLVLRVKARPASEDTFLPTAALPLEIDLRFEPAAAEPGTRVAHAASSLVQVTLRPRSARWTSEQFEEATRRLLWQLRSHFLAV